LKGYCDLFHIFCSYSDSTIHQQVQENLAKAWGIIENNLETFSIQLYRRMHKLDPSLFPMFPFYQDEWARVTHTDYNGSFVEQPANTWFLLFR
jgi:predicted ester cyclase